MSHAMTIQLPPMKPILFSAPMVRAILEGRKTQTRRIVKPQPQVNAAGDVHFPWATFFHNGLVHTWDSDGVGGENWDASEWPNENKYEQAIKRTQRRRACPYGVPGDRLWVRETWGSLDDAIGTAKSDPGTRALIDGCFYAADYFPHEEIVSRWRPSIHMPRWASRITLIVKSVRVERVQDITEEDARAEGIEPHGVAEFNENLTPKRHGWKDYGGSDGYFPEARMSFKTLWNSIHGPGAWDRDDWVWAYRFERGAP